MFECELCGESRPDREAVNGRTDDEIVTACRLCVSQREDFERIGRGL